MGRARNVDGIHSDAVVLQAADQRALDQASYVAGVPHGALMESAGRAAAEWILEHVRPHRVLCVAGPGGNGGDALVVARCVADAGVDVRVLLLTEPDGLSSMTAEMLTRLEPLSISVRSLAELGPEERTEILAWPTHIVDGLFGSGLNRPLSDDIVELVERIDETDALLISLDVPSGVHADGGVDARGSLTAQITLAMEFLKPAHLLYPAAGQCGNTAIVRVDYPEEQRSLVSPWAVVPTHDSTWTRLPARMATGHKGSFGRVLVVAGSPGMTGAAVLACQGALRAGAGLVYLASPDSLRPVYQTALPEIICVSWPGEPASDGVMSFDACHEIADVVAVGPGLGRSRWVETLMQDLTTNYHGPLVVDADGLTPLGNAPELLGRLSGRAILTPHPGEMSRLVHRPSAEIDRCRRDVAAEFAAKHGVVTLLKGLPTIVAVPGEPPVANPTGHHGLGTGGSGDVLTGLIAGLLAGGCALGNSAVSAAYLHGLAAEIFSRDRAARSLTPGDLIELIPYAFGEIEPRRHEAADRR